jgi:hypothetical protein
MALGSYLAICEGDDYWVDPQKLQKQVDFLEKNPDYVISGHDAVIIDENGNIQAGSKLPKLYHKDFDGEDLILGNVWILTLSMVMRNFPDQMCQERRMVLNGDNFLTSILGQYGKSHHHEDIKPAVYRVHDGGVWSKISNQEKLESQLNTLFWMYKYYKRIGHADYAKYYWFKYVRFFFLRANLIELSREYSIRVLFLREQKAFLRRILQIWKAAIG